MKESFEEIVNILENRYKSYSPHHYDMYLKTYHNMKKQFLKNKMDNL